MSADQQSEDTVGEREPAEPTSAKEDVQDLGGGDAQRPTDSQDAGAEVDTKQTAEEKSDSGSAYDLEPTEDSVFRMGGEEQVDPAVIQQLTDGFVEGVLPGLEKSKASIDEILSNQIVLIETVEQENSKFKECTAFTDLCNMMAKAKEYHSKLVTIKKDMVNLHDKAGKLKRRALKLQQQKQKEELQRAHQQERELEKEQMLTARVARPDT